MTEQLSLHFSSGYISKRNKNRISKRHVHSLIHCSVTHKSQDKETSYVSINRPTDKTNVLHTPSGIAFSHKKEILPFVTTWRDLKGITLSQTKTNTASVQLLNHVWLFVTPWTAACQTSLSITNSWSLLILMSIELVMPAIQPSHPLMSPSPPAFNLSQHQGLFQWVSSSHWVAKVLEFQLQHQSLQMNIQDWFPLGLTGWISLQSKGLSRVSHGIAYKWNLKKKPHRESIRDPGVRENGEMLVKEYRLLVIKGISSGSLMYNMMIIIFDNTISCTWKLLKDSRS